MEGKMARCIIAIAITGFLIFLAITFSVSAAQPQPDKASDNDATQLKALQDEQVKVLTQLVEGLAAQYKSGSIHVAEVCSAENELCNALYDATDEPEQRIAVLAKQAERAGDLIKLVQGRYDAGTLIYTDVCRAKSLYLGIKIKLLRERSRKRPSAPDATGKRA
jgi:outer membrane protein TolC